MDHLRKTMQLQSTTQNSTIVELMLHPHSGRTSFKSIRAHHFHFFLSLSLDLIRQSIDCTFEEGWCNFFQDKTADFEWERTNTASPSSNTGPGFGRIFHDWIVSVASQRILSFFARRSHDRIRLLHLYRSIFPEVRVDHS